MKKILTTLVGGALLASSLSADFARVEMGVGAWMQTPSGEVSYEESGATGNDVSDEKDSTEGYAWVLIKHPVPVLPNLRLEYASTVTTGKVSGGFEDFTIPNGEVSDSKLESTQYDIIPYYNILDNTAWVTLDLGIDLKIMETSYKATALEVSGVEVFEGYSDSASTVLPLLYVRGRVEIPVTNIGVEADIKYISYDTATMYDARVKVDYTLDMIPVVQPAIEIGYRVQKMDIDDDDATVDLEFSGVYVGMMLRF